MRIEDLPEPECRGGYSDRQMEQLFGSLGHEWEVFDSLMNTTTTFSQCGCAGEPHGDVRTPVEVAKRFVKWIESKRAIVLR